MHLLIPTLIGFRRQLQKRSWSVLLMLIFCGVLIGGAVFFGLFKFLDYVGRAPMLGPILGPMVGHLLVDRLLEMIFLALFCMLIFSSLIAAFSVFYLDEELKVLFSSPVSTGRIFWSRFTLMVVESSWMAGAFFIPIFFAFIAAGKSAWPTYVLFPGILVLYLLLPNLLGAVTAVLLGALFPIRQMRKVFQFLSVMVLTGMVFFFRFMEPEKLLNPNYFSDVSRYILSLRSPMMEWFPSSWVREATADLIAGAYRDAGMHLLPLIGILAGGFLILHLMARSFYRFSWQRSLEAVENQVKGLEWIRRFLIWPLRFFREDIRVVAAKEITIFFRDPAIFSQLFMMMAIVFVYGYNLSILPLKDIPQLYSGEVNDSLVYFNGPFIGFILSAISMRFVYPSISLEGRAFWAVKSSPIRPSRLLTIKYFLYLLPNLSLGLLLCFISNQMFQVTSPSLRILSFFNVTVMAIVTTALAIGIGTIYARFDADNPLKISGSFGGFVFMITSGIFIINLLVCQVYPMYRFYFTKYLPLQDLRSQVLIAASVVLMLACSAAWTLIPLAKGREAIERYEPE